MKQKTKQNLKNILPVIIILLVTAVGAWGFGSGMFGRVVDVFRGGEGETQPGEVNTDVELENVLPKDMHGLWLRAGVDYPAAPADEAAVKSAVDEIFASLEELFVDTLFVPLESAQAQGFDAPGYIIETAKAKNIYCVLAVPASSILTDTDALTGKNDALVNAVRTYRPQAVLLDGFDKLTFKKPTKETSAALTDKVLELLNVVKTVSPDTLTGFACAPVWAHKAETAGGSDTAKHRQTLKDNSADTKAWAESPLTDFVYLRPGPKTTDKDANLATLTAWWNETLKKQSAYAILGIDAANIGPEELASQLQLLPPLQSFCGSALVSYAGLRGNESTKKAYLEHMSATAANLQTGTLTISRPASKRTVTNESTITFMGTADPAYPLTCNGTELPKSSLGLFSVSLQLVAGDNEFTFSHNGTSLTYTVTYELNLLSAILPQGKTEAPGGTLITLSALAYKQAKVYAKVGNTRVELHVSEQNYFGQSAAPSDFATFVGSYALPALTKKKSLGTVTFFASFNGREDSLNGGEIAVLPQSGSANPSPTPQAPTNYVSLYKEKNLPLKTAYQNHGKGTALLCEALKDYSETTPIEYTDDQSSPLCRPLLKGTFDYVKSVATYNGVEYYILGSGTKAYARDVKLLTDGYVLPENNLNVISSGTQNGETTILFKTDWLVPVSALLSPQRYYNGYQSRPFSVQSFDAECLDLTFHYTPKAGGNINLSGSNVLKSARFINVGVDGKSTLRLELKSKGHFYGYSLTLTDAGELQLIIRNRDTSIKNKVIALDPGHGGADPGAIGVYSSVYESQLNLLISLKVKAALEKMGATVIMTRTGDTEPTLVERSLMARRQRPDVFVSIHHDASTSSVNSGTHTFYYTPFSMPLAKAIQTNMVSAYQKNKIIPKGTAEYAQINQGIKFYPFHVTRLEECPSVLVECGYLTNAVNASGLLVENNQNAIAAAIAEGIKDYFKAN